LYRKPELEWNDANGFSVWTTKGNTGRSDKLAERAIECLLEKIPFRLRADERDGDRDQEADFYIIKKTSMPAILIECGFMTNFDECTKLKDPVYRERIADAIVDLVLSIDENNI